MRLVVDASAATALCLAYDAEYIALALVEGAPLLTIDIRLARRAKDLVETRSPSDL